MKAYFIKVENALIPFDDNCKPFNRLEQGEEVEIDITNKRNIKFHRKFFALIKLAFDNQENYTNIEDLRKDLIIQSGYYNERTNYITEEVIIEAQSISFSSMEEQEFEKVYNSVLDSVCSFLRSKSEDIINELMSF